MCCLHSVIIILALLVAKDIKWKIRVILINILVAEIIFSLSRSANFLGFPIRQMFNISDTTSVPLCVMFFMLDIIIGTLAKVGTIARDLCYNGLCLYQVWHHESEVVDDNFTADCDMGLLYRSVVIRTYC